MQVKAILCEKVSKKGNTYTCVEIYITENIKKLVFLTDAEKELLQIKESKSDLNMPDFR